MGWKGITAELKLIIVAVGCALLLVFGHLILAKQLIQYAWVEYTAAGIPFLLFAIAAWAIRYTLRLEQKN
ncbi:hypothetical protein BIZ37_29640 [Photobacterium sp. BZF1]|uniref:Asparaginyl-tRNA synthetase n=1 Tax=Photobacterium rosenbergii TaxID=294936 RepID=A0A2T3NA47_9GAMM|nr:MULTISPECIES: hypothetical protein [Photobacterium]MBC7006714.1 hypothetical protein [Photobacterium sp. BZF1]PSW10505.1 hypothetical protein C9J01_18065 [Photobacterium rosenbergii]